MRLHNVLVGLIVLGIGVSRILAQPPNDDCPGFNIPSLPYFHNGTTVNANDSYTGFCTETAQRDVVYSITRVVTTAVRVSLCGSEFDSQLFVRTGGGCPGTTDVMCDDFGCTGSSGPAQLTFTALAGVTYYMIVDGNEGDFGTFTLQVSDAALAAPMYHDMCPGYSLTRLPYLHSSSTTAAADNYSLTCAAGDGSETIYNLMLACSSQVTASLCGSTYDTQLLVRTGGACPGTFQVDCNNEFCGVQSQVSFLALPGTLYYLIVGGFGASVGNYTLSVDGDEIVAGDRCPGLPITSLPYTYNGTLTCANYDYGLICYAHPVSPDIQFSLTLPCNTVATAALCGSAITGELAIRTGGTCPGSTAVLCSFSGCPDGDATATFTANAGQTYYINVHDVNGVRNPFTFNVTGVPQSVPGDLCPGIQIMSLPYASAGSTLCAQDQYGDCVTSYAPEVFYSFTPLCTTPLTASLCGSLYDTVLELRRDGACPGDNAVWCNDDYCDLQSRIDFVAEGGVPYYFIISGYGQTGFGLYTLNVIGGTPQCNPDSLVIQAGGANLVLDWTRVNAAVQYNVYRGAEPDFPLDIGHFIATVADTYFVDLNAALAPDLARFYAVTAQLP